MSLYKIDFFYKKGETYFYGKNHHEVFAKKVLAHVKCQDFLITDEWEKTRENSLIIAFEYQGFHHDLENFAQHKPHETYRRIFFINWTSISDVIAPIDYKNKCFAGNLFRHAYTSIMEEWKPSSEFSRFYADSAALDNLRVDTAEANKQWSLSAVFDTGLYDLVYCKIDIVKVLGLFLYEYMEKYDFLRNLNPLATNHANSFQSEVDRLDEHSLDEAGDNAFAFKVSCLESFFLHIGGSNKISDSEVSEIYARYTIEEMALFASKYTAEAVSIDSLFLRDHVFPGDIIRLATVKLMAYAYNINKNLTLSEYPEYIAKMQEQIKTAEDLKQVKRDYPKIYSFMAQKAYKLGQILEKDLLGE